MTDLAIIKQENINLIMQDAPKAYSENKVSHDRCIQFGQDLLATIQQQGMADDLDQQAAKYINMSKATVKKMNEKRSPLTKLFDEIRTQFTTFENEIDPTKKGTVPYQIQQLRNQLAAKKRAEEEAKRQELIKRQQEEQARAMFRTECDKSHRGNYHDLLDFYLSGIRNLFASVTLTNYEQRLQDIQNASVSFPTESIYESFPYSGSLPGSVSGDERDKIFKETLDALLPGFRSDFKWQMEQERQRLLDLMPSKKQELERAAKASAEEAERIRKEMAEREAAEAARLEAERAQREQQERQAAEMKKQAEAMDGLFANAEANMQAYSPKTSVKKRLVPLNVEAFPEIISMWWTKEGQHLSVEELSKMFKKQITFCEKCAKEGEFISSEHIFYEDEVKAK
ncbi:MAG: hypothetical protein IJ197_08855 [Bacteroidaceae bacterium]|nr:hypothetical protein [Bacteroidaceae bacterium]